jgi:hypothetical protein
LLLLYAPAWAPFLAAQEDGRFAGSGQFGDSFGAIASFMTTVAAVGVYLTYRSESEAGRTKEFEDNFFTLLRNFESVTAQLKLGLLVADDSAGFKARYHKLNRIGASKVIKSHEGRTVPHVILLILRDEIGPTGYSDIKTVARAYNKVFDKYVQFLGHYFRSLYHVYRLIEDKCPGDKSHYARIVRAQLSNSELCLLCYNCIVGEGRFKMKKLAAEHAMFHNLHRERLDKYEAAELRFFRRKLPNEAFRFDPITPITYDD